MCKLLTEKSSIPAYKKLGQFNSIMLNKTNQTCLDYSYDNMIQELRNVSWGNDEGKLRITIRVWTLSELLFWYLNTNDFTLEFQLGNGCTKHAQNLGFTKHLQQKLKFSETNLLSTFSFNSVKIYSERSKNIAY